MDYFQKLKAASPALYHICLLVIGVSSALAIYKSIGVNHSYTEILVFIGFGIFLFCIATLLKFIMDHEVRRVIFSAIVVTGAAGFYATQNINSTFIKDLSPSAGSQSTWCGFIPYLCSTIEVKNTMPSSSIDVTLGTMPEGKNIVYFQFAGRLNRDNDIIPYLKKLTEEGWNGQGFKEGGERTEAAIGYNEVRYYHSEDKENAQRLINAVNKAKPPKGAGKNMKLQLLDPAKLGNPEIGTLEVWISN